MATWNSDGFEEELHYEVVEDLPEPPSLFTVAWRVARTYCRPGMGMTFFLAFAFFRALFYYFGMGRRPRPRLNNGDDISARPGISQKTSKKKA